MKTPTRTDHVLDEWRSVTAAVPLNARPAPRERSRSFGALGLTVATMAILAVLWARGNIGTTGSPGQTAAAAAPSPSPLMTATPSVTPSPAPLATQPPVALPNPGGTCTASQLTLGKATTAYGFGSIGTTAVDITQPIRNRGSDCTLVLPTMIAVAPDGGEFVAVKVAIVGPETSFRIPSKGQLTIVLGALWYDAQALQSLSRTPPPCDGSVADATHGLFPVAQGTLVIDFGTALKSVCSSPPSMSVGTKASG